MRVALPWVLMVQVPQLTQLAPQALPHLLWVQGH
jgi:hypothetical protein